MPTRGLLKSLVEPARPPPRQQEGGAKANPQTILIFAVVIIAALHFGQDIFIPVAVAILLSFILAPLVRLLRRIYVPRVLAVLIVVSLAFMILTGIFGVVVSQVRDLANNLPRYEYNLRNKIRSIDFSMPEDSAFLRAIETLREVGQELERQAAPEEEGAEEPPAPAGPTPMPQTSQEGQEQPEEPVVVRIRPEPQSAWQRVQSNLEPLFRPLAIAGLVVVFVVFMLLKREDLRDRVIRLAGAEDVLRTTAALNDAASRVSRYLLMQLVINVTYAILVALGLWVIGVPNPLLWGLLAAVLRFIPYAGPIIAAIMPIALAFAVDPGWSMLLMTIGLLI
ncbi:MAG TPA: AI-2E family transporter, partial [Kiloniellales bacterium]|nr:AI-2E family transporter [Kiloniellales bacterium]